MTNEAELRERLRKIEALFAGAGTDGERMAADAARARVQARLAELERRDSAIEMQFSMPDQWSRRLFVALCRRYGLKPYRYRRQRLTTVVLRVPRGFIDQVLWPEFTELTGRFASSSTRSPSGSSARRSTPMRAKRPRLPRPCPPAAHRRADGAPHALGARHSDGALLLDRTSHERHRSGALPAEELVSR